MFALLLAGQPSAAVDALGAGAPTERSNSNATYRLQIQGLTPNPATAAQTETYLAGQNPLSSLGGGFYAGKRVSVSQGDTFEACTLPF
jgi:hypothetical protein